MHKSASRPARPRSSYRRAIPLAIGLAALGGTVLAIPAAAATATGPDGQSLTVSTVDGLDPSGATVTVTGSGYDLSKGIYVAVCVNQGAGQLPSPCLGGADTEGSGGASAWISSNPPGYGEGLAAPFEEKDGKGSFSVELHVTAKDTVTDCLDPAVAPNGCVIGTRADHTRTGDRSADVLIPLTFATGSGSESGDDGPDGGTADGTADGVADGSASGDAQQESGTAGAGADGAASTSGGPDDLASTGTSPTAVVVALFLAAVGAALVIVRRQASHAITSRRTL